MLKVYVAGAWVEKKERAEKWIAKLREVGIEITHDWTVDETPCAPGYTDKDLPVGERRSRAEADTIGVLKADVLWLLAPTERGASGAWTELGIALGASWCNDDSNLKIVASGAKHDRTIFTSLADASFRKDEDAFEYITNLLREKEVTRAMQGANPDAAYVHMSNWEIIDSAFEVTNKETPK